MNSFKWDLIDNLKENGVYTSTYVAQVPGGMLVRTVSYPIEESSFFTETMVFVPKVEKKA